MDSTVSTPKTNSTNEPSLEDAANFHLYFGITISSIVFIFLLMIPTLLFNGMTLYAIYKDPLKCFRSALSTFTSCILIADFISALIVFPFYGSAYASDLSVGETAASGEIFHIAIEILTGTVIISFLTLLGLAVAQLIALNSPLRYDSYVSVRGVKIGVICVWVYAAVFTTISHFFNNKDFFYWFFLVFHISIVTVALVILYIVTYLVFSVRVARQLEEQESKQVSKEFFKGTCILALVQILLVWPGTIALYAESFLEETDIEREVNIEIALIVCDNLLFTKFLLDPIILVWRVPKYRSAMKVVFPWCFGPDKGAHDHKRRVAYSRSNGKNPDESLDDVEVEDV